LRGKLVMHFCCNIIKDDLIFVSMPLFLCGVKDPSCPGTEPTGRLKHLTRQWSSGWGQYIATFSLKGTVIRKYMCLSNMNLMIILTQFFDSGKLISQWHCQSEFTMWMNAEQNLVRYSLCESFCFYRRSLGREDIVERIPSISVAPSLPSLAMLQVNTEIANNEMVYPHISFYLSLYFPLFPPLYSRMVYPHIFPHIWADISSYSTSL
jgi:hypothetical protein